MTWSSARGDAAAGEDQPESSEQLRGQAGFGAYVSQAMARPEAMLNASRMVVAVETIGVPAANAARRCARSVPAHIETNEIVGSLGLRSSVVWWMQPAHALPGTCSEAVAYAW